MRNGAADHLAEFAERVYASTMGDIKSCLDGPRGISAIAGALRLAVTGERIDQPQPIYSTTGHITGVYRFANHEEIKRHDEEALARAIAAEILPHLIESKPN